MKRNSTWLAAGLLLFAVIACNLSKNSNSNNNNSKNSNSSKNSNAPIKRAADAEIYVSTLSMAKDDNGKAGGPQRPLLPMITRFTQKSLLTKPSQARRSGSFG